MSKFPVPISGEKIPHGWFANLVRFVNSLTLRGDGRYTMVSRNESGTTVTLTPAVKNAIERTGGTPPGSGGGAIGFPNYFSTSQIPVSDSNSYDLTQDMWLIGRVQSRSYTGDPCFYLNVVPTGSTSTPLSIRLLMMGDESPSIFRDNFICIPLHSGLTISFTKDYIGMTSSLILYPCI